MPNSLLNNASLWPSITTSIIIFLSVPVMASLSGDTDERNKLSSSPLINLPNNEVNSFSINWQWTDSKGKNLKIKSFFDTDIVETSLLDSYKLSFSLSYPIKAIHTYLTPRLEFAIDRINFYTPDDQDKIKDIRYAFTNKDESNASQLFWQAYNQYQNDAFYHLKITPCVHPDDEDLPCVRPNYSQLFYEYRAYLKDIATQLAKQQSIDSAVKNAQNWVYAIPDRKEHKDSFFSPISVLKTNEADSDEKALLLATLISQLAPEYELFMLYPSDSIGSVSPVWLTIDSKSGVKGQQIMINKNQYTVISGSKVKLDKILSSDTELINESLY
ncbi:hypothetical protein [Moritella viscosa]|nr:hypothetical protein [Moritella viscosa]CED58650.1 putative exported protein [Moritella viscosa]SHN97659.1 Putative uncharacterized protein [Moritella viscosa]SHN98206.1 Putative uncharacterized protein [Moritella viscosa]SHO24301.1 Putative uncharacterized protein [Moritella viscosa]